VKKLKQARIKFNLYETRTYIPQTDEGHAPLSS
jgi:hypothetical protein